MTVEDGQDSNPLLLNHVKDGVGEAVDEHPSHGTVKLRVLPGSVLHGG